MFKEEDAFRRVVIPRDCPAGAPEERGVLLGPAPDEEFKVWVRVDTRYRRRREDDGLRICDEDYVVFEEDYQ